MFSPSFHSSLFLGLHQVIVTPLHLLSSYNVSLVSREQQHYKTSSSTVSSYIFYSKKENVSSFHLLFLYLWYFFLCRYLHFLILFYSTVRVVSSSTASEKKKWSEKWSFISLSFFFYCYNKRISFIPFLDLDSFFSSSSASFISKITCDLMHILHILASSHPAFYSSSFTLFYPLNPIQSDVKLSFFSSWIFDSETDSDSHSIPFQSRNFLPSDLCLIIISNFTSFFSWSPFQMIL